MFHFESLPPLFFPLSDFTVNHRIWPMFVLGDTEAEVAGPAGWLPAIFRQCQTSQTLKDGLNATVHCSIKALETWL